MLQTRLTQHQSDIKTKKDTSIATHFNMENLDVRDLLCSAICDCSHNVNMRLHHEEAWIHLLATSAPNGLNVMS